MRINFFEEYPLDFDESPLSKADLLGDRSSTIYLAARSLEEFYEARHELYRINPHEGIVAAYWPIIQDAYWISPYAPTSELLRILHELRTWKWKAPVLIDLEPPHPMNRFRLFFENVSHYSSNRRIIEDILNANVKIVTAEASLPASDFGRQLLLERLGGISYPNGRHMRCIMYYTSTIPSLLLSSVQRMVKKGALEYGDRLEVGLGCLATGAYGNEPILTPENLRRDLAFVQSIGVRTVTLFRLGGLTEDYLKVISEFSEEEA